MIRRVFQILSGNIVPHPFSSLLVVACYHSKFLASGHFGTRAAGRDIFAFGTLANRAQMVAERCFDSFDAAAGAVNHFGSDNGVVEFRPFFGNLLTQIVVVVDSGNARLAFFAV